MVRLPKWFLLLLVCAIVLGMAGIALADEATGKVKRVDAAAGTVVITVDGKDVTFVCEKKLLEKIENGDEVAVTYTKEGEKMVATAIKPKE